eukprot:131476-Lingulodinium_polyedra.AAC.1
MYCRVKAVALQAFTAPFVNPEPDGKYACAHASEQAERRWCKQLQRAVKPKLPVRPRAGALVTGSPSGSSACVGVDVPPLGVPPRGERGAH